MVIADLHCHFPMHLVPDEEIHPREHVRRWWRGVVDRVRGEGLEVAARFFNDKAWCDDWRVSLDGLEAGGAGLVCSVLYWPFSEFEIESFDGAPPDAGAFDHLMHQLERVELELARIDPERQRHVVVTQEAQLDDPRIRFVHCVEGGFHLGPDEAAVADQIRQLAGRGVFYITLAHLFFRQVAADAPAIPALTDAEYNRLFRQPREGLTGLGRAAIRAMCEAGVVVDISHMRRDVVGETLAELDAADPDRTIPVIATHVGAEAAGPPDHAYNLTPETMQAIRDRGGVIGIIAAQHLLGATTNVGQSKVVIRRHIDAVHDAVGSHACTALGTDMDGFIKPMISGLDTAADLVHLQDWIQEAYPADAEAILHGNAERVIRRVLRGRA